MKLNIKERKTRGDAERAGEHLRSKSQLINNRSITSRNLWENSTGEVSGYDYNAASSTQEQRLRLSLRPPSLAKVSFSPNEGGVAQRSEMNLNGLTLFLLSFPQTLCSEFIQHGFSHLYGDVGPFKPAVTESV